MKRAVFLDRDGVVNETEVVDGVPRPPQSVAEVVVGPTAAADLARLRAAGFVLVVVTNQPDVARGTLDRDAAHAINAELRARLPIDAVYCCFHDTGDGCTCRKPRPGLVTDAARDLGIDLDRSWLIGDRWVDVAAASAAGVRGVLVEREYSWHPTSEGAPPPDVRPLIVSRTLVDAVDRVLAADDSG